LEGQQGRISETARQAEQDRQAASKTASKATAETQESRLREARAGKSGERMTMSNRCLYTTGVVLAWLTFTTGFQTIAPPRVHNQQHVRTSPIVIDQQLTRRSFVYTDSVCLRVANGDSQEEGIFSGQRLKRVLKYPFRKVRAVYRLFKREVNSAWDSSTEILKDPPNPFKDLNLLGSNSQETSSTASLTTTTATAETTSMSTTNAAVSTQDMQKQLTAVQETAYMPSPVMEMSYADIQEAVGNLSTESMMTTAARQAVAAPDVDLSGQWKLIVTDDFKEEYDKYLTLLGQPFLVRSVALGIIGMTTEETIQTEQGRSLEIKGRNVRGVWDRTLIASGEDQDAGIPVSTSIVTADGETVEAEAWWEDQGRVHRSWLRGVKKYGGGAFESKRYLEESGNVYVCESIFHPEDAAREKARVTWRFQKELA
jgi:hypothetical protein